MKCIISMIVILTVVILVTIVISIDMILSEERLGEKGNYEMQIIKGKSKMTVILIRNGYTTWTAERARPNRWTISGIRVSNQTLEATAEYEDLKYDILSNKWSSRRHPLITRVIKRGLNISVEMYDWISGWTVQK